MDAILGMDAFPVLGIVVDGVCGVVEVGGQKVSVDGDVFCATDVEIPACTAVRVPIQTEGSGGRSVLVEGVHDSKCRSC